MCTDHNGILLFIWKECFISFTFLHIVLHFIAFHYIVLLRNKKLKRVFYG